MAMPLTEEQKQNAVEMTAFLVVQADYEYNDEYNYLTDGVNPKVVYFDARAAQAEADRLQETWEEAEDINDWDDEIPGNMFRVIAIQVRQ